MKAFLYLLEQRSIPYVSWKNNHNLNMAMEGAADLDIFVPFSFASAFRQAIKDEHWLVFINPVARYPYIQHFYKINDDGYVFHLHVYFRVVTGDSWLKEYVLPLDSWLIENREWSSEWDIWVLNNKAQAYLFVLRHLVKNGSVTGRLLYYKCFHEYRAEWEHCQTSILNSRPDDFISLQPYLIPARLGVDSFDVPSWFSSIRLRCTLIPLLRFSLLSILPRRTFHFIHRAMNKLIFKEKKVLSDQGMIIAITGTDGSGKTTLTKEVISYFGSFLTVRGAKLGKPQPEWVDKFSSLVQQLIRGSKRRTNSSPQIINEAKGLFSAFKGLVLAFFRLVAARSAVKKSLRGYLVITDRWPTTQVGFMDGPKICSSNSGQLSKLVSSLEKWLYARIPRADLCIYIRVSVDEAVKRNSERNKFDKESDDDIRIRYKGSLDHRALAVEFIDFDNNGSFSDKRVEFIMTVWNSILARYG